MRGTMLEPKKMQRLFRTASIHVHAHMYISRAYYTRPGVRGVRPAGGKPGTVLIDAEKKVEFVGLSTSPAFQVGPIYLAPGAVAQREALVGGRAS